LKLEPISQVIITKDFNRAIELLHDVAPDDALFELFIKEDGNFLVSDANEVIQKAYLTSQNQVFLCLASQNFSDVVQNRLLKIIEEPPKNKIFILITPSKATILPTIKSRLPITTLKDEIQEIEIDLNLKTLTLKDVYNFIQQNRRLKPNEATIILEKIVKDAIKSKAYNFDEQTLNLFSKLRVALDMGSPADFILTTLLLKLLAKKIKR